MDLLLCALSGYFLTLVVKQFFPMRSNWPKLGWAVAGSGGAAYLIFRNHPYELAVYTVAGAGLAIGIHRLFRLMTLAGDRQISEVLRNRGRT